MWFFLAGLLGFVLICCILGMLGLRVVLTGFVWPLAQQMIGWIYQLGAHALAPRPLPAELEDWNWRRSAR